jgi:hypothetical protein
MNRTITFALLAMTGCASPRHERFLQVSATQVDEGTLVGLQVDEIVAPAVLLDSGNGEAQIFVGDEDENGYHALVQVDGPLVSVEAWERKDGVETWRERRTATIRTPGRCSDPERFLAR